MSKDYFDKEKQEYENIDIPQDLDFMVRKTLKEGRRRKRNKIISRAATAVAGIFIAFVLVVNLFPKVAYAASLIPGIDRLVELVTFDKGFSNAVDQGLSKELNFEETQNGITLKVGGLAGDWKMLWVYYSVDDGSGIQKLENGAPKYDVGIDLILPEEFKDGGYSIGSKGINNDGESVSAIQFPQFIENFTLEFNVYENTGVNLRSGDDRTEPNCVAKFQLPIILEPEIFNSPLKEVTIDNNIIPTSVGNIVIENIKSSKTRIEMRFTLQSDIYDYMSYENPRLVDDKGNEYKTGEFYRSEDINENKLIEFAGEIKDGIKSLKFECDGVYYARKDNRNIVINLKEKLVEPNDYGFTFISEDKSEAVNNGVIMIESNQVKGASFKEVNNKNGEVILQNEGTGYYGSDEEGYTTKVYFKIFDDNLEKVTANLYWVLKDKTEPVSAKIIK